MHSLYFADLNALDYSELCFRECCVSAKKKQQKMNKREEEKSRRWRQITTEQSKGKFVTYLIYYLLIVKY